MSKESIDRLREKAQNEQTVLGLAEVLRLERQRVAELQAEVDAANARFETRTVDFNNAYNANISYAAKIRKLESELLKKDERIKEHEMFRHQHRDCDAMSVENQRLRADVAKLKDDAAIYRQWHARDVEHITALQASHDDWRDRYNREVLGLNNEGDPIGGEPPRGLKHAVESLREQVLTLQSCQMAWQPIETAPKSTAKGRHVTGVYILGFCPSDDDQICVVWWEPLMNDGNGLWYFDGGYDVVPTHWMPLPPPPLGGEQLNEGLTQQQIDRGERSGKSTWPDPTCMECGRPFSEHGNAGRVCPGQTGGSHNG